MLKWRKLSRSPCILPPHGGPVWLRVCLVQVSPTGLLIFAMLHIHHLLASIVKGVSISQDLPKELSCFVCFSRSDLLHNVFCLGMRYVLFYSEIFSLAHFHYQCGRSGTGFLNNTQYSVCDGVPGSAQLVAPLFHSCLLLQLFTSPFFFCLARSRRLLNCLTFS